MKSLGKDQLHLGIQGPLKEGSKHQARPFRKMFGRGSHGESDADILRREHAPPMRIAHLLDDYSILKIAEMWSLSERTIRRMFEGEKGAVNWGRAKSRRKRCYQTLRIPESVMLRVYQRIRKAG
jgi:hypothetical protein